MHPSEAVHERQIFRIYFCGLRFLALASCASPIPAYAQFNASLSGTVQDSTGAIVPNATVTLTNPATHQVLKTTTSTDAGVYHFNRTASGATTRSRSPRPAFKASTFADVALAAETPRNLNVTLSTGDVSETVTVNANEVSALQSADASIGSTISERSHPAAAHRRRQPLRASANRSRHHRRRRARRQRQCRLSAQWRRPRRIVARHLPDRKPDPDLRQWPAASPPTPTRVDGVTVDSLTHGGSAVVTPNQEAIGQITILSTSYDAADGRNSGAQIKVVTKSGTNDLHGSLYFLYDEPGLNAFAKYGGPDDQKPLRVETKQRTYDASLGGPIIKDKLFGFASYAGFGLGANTTVSQYVETAGLPRARRRTASRRHYHQHPHLARRHAAHRQPSSHRLLRLRQQSGPLCSGQRSTRRPPAAAPTAIR